MACYECEDCKKVIQEIPWCDDLNDPGINSITFGKIADNYTPAIEGWPRQVRVRITKPNGAVAEVLTTTLGEDDRQVIVYISEMPSANFLNGESGWIKAEFLSNADVDKDSDGTYEVMAGERFTIADPFGTEAECLLFRMSRPKFDAADGATIVCKYE